MGYDIDQVISCFLTVTVSTNSEFAKRNLNSGLNVEFYYLSVLICKTLFSTPKNKINIFILTCNILYVATCRKYNINNQSSQGLLDNEGD